MSLDLKTLTTTWVGLDLLPLTGVRDILVDPIAQDFLVYTASTGLDGAVASWTLSEGTLQQSEFSAPMGTPIAGRPPVLLQFDDAGGSSIRSWGADWAPSSGDSIGLDLPNTVRSLSSVTLDGVVNLYVSQSDGAQLERWTLTPETGLVLQGPSGQAIDVGSGGITASVHVSTSSADWIITLSDGDDTVSSFQIGQDGDLTLTGTLDQNAGLGIAVPTVVKAAQIAGETFVLVGGSGSNSLTVLGLDNTGTFDVRDHVFDNRETRFEAITSLETHTVGDVTYVVAAGADDGLSLLQLLPTGQLLHLLSLEDRTDLGLSDISTISLAQQNDRLTIIAASESEAGLTFIDVGFAPSGTTTKPDAASQTLVGTDANDVLSGGAGNDFITSGDGADILIDGSGQDTLVGESGADVFVFVSDGEPDQIADFEIGVDRLDLSGWAFLRNTGQLEVTVRAGGADISFADEVLSIQTHDGSTPSAEAFTGSGTIGLDRFLPSWFDNLDPIDPKPEPEPDPEPEPEPKPSVQLGSDGNDTLRGSNSDDSIFGGNGDDTLFGQAGSDTLRGGNGDDTLLGGANRDFMMGGMGDDIFHVNDAAERVVEYEGEGFDTVISIVQVTLGRAEIERIVLEGSAKLRVNGNEYATQITGNDKSNILIGGGGGDVITGGGGHDYFAFLISDAEGVTTITDFSAPDQIALDDRYFNLGDKSVDVRDVTRQQIDNALSSGAAAYSARTGELSIRQDGELITIAVIEGGGQLGPDDLLLF